MSSNVDTTTRAIGAGSLLLFGVGYVFQITALAAVGAVVLIVVILRMLALESH